MDTIRARNKHLLNHYRGMSGNEDGKVHCDTCREKNASIV